MRRLVIAGFFGLVVWLQAMTVAPPSAIAADWLDSLFAPSADLWPYWASHDDTSAGTVDHGPWAHLLESHVRAGADGIARFDYGAMAADDRAGLRSYIDSLAAITVTRHGRAEQLAYWVNLYNALTVQVVLDAYPVASILDIDISPGLFSDGPWDAELVIIEGRPVTLNDIEHRILRPLWGDARVHYVLNCASLGCPDLARAPLVAASAEAELDRAAQTFVNHPRAFSLDGDGLTVSSIYLWFQEDFGGDDRAVIEHLKQYATPERRAMLEAATEIDDHAYDWSLNDATD